MSLWHIGYLCTVFVRSLSQRVVPVSLLELVFRGYPSLPRYVVLVLPQGLSRALTTTGDRISTRTFLSCNVFGAGASETVGPFSTVIFLQNMQNFSDLPELTSRT